MIKKVVAFLFLSAPALAGYNFTTPLIVMHGQVGGVETNFPVLVQTSNVIFSTSSSGGHLLNSSGYDLVFATDPYCNYKVNWDTETVNNTGSAQMNIWVRIPSVSNVTDTVFYACYGNAAITTYQGISTATWDSNYDAVYHLTNGVVLNPKDSTVNALNAADSGFGTTSAVNGFIDGGVSVGSGSGLDTASTSPGTNITLSAWIFATSFDGNGDTVISQQQNDGTFPANDNWQLCSSPGGGGTAPRMLVSYGGSFDDVSSGSSISLNTWYYLVGTYDGSTIAVYLNAIAATKSSANTMNNISQPIYIGRFQSANGFNFNGTLDEVRVSNIARNAGWVTTEYNNQSNPSGFLIFDTEINNTILSENEKGIVMDGGKVTLNGGKLVVQ